MPVGDLLTEAVPCEQRIPRVALVSPVPWRHVVMKRPGRTGDSPEPSDHLRRDTKNVLVGTGQVT